jgi:L-arabinonolactonase
MMKISRLDTVRCLLGEGPVWDVATHSLYFLDTGHRLVHRFNPRNGATSSCEIASGVGAMALREAGGAVLAMGDSICKQAPEPGGGDLYVIEGLGARGLPESRYAG